MRWLPLVLLGCVPMPRDLGTIPEDAVKVADADVLAHLAAARDDDLTVAELIRRRPGRFVAPPDPTALIAGAAEHHASLPELADAVELRVLAYNVGLLDRTYLGTRVQVPEIEARREAAPRALFELGYDVLLLQEIWEWDDAIAIEEAAAEAGYATWSGTWRKHVQHGLMIAVKLEHIGGRTQLGEAQYRAQRKLERWPGPDVKRGWLTMGFDLADTGRRITFVNTHATSYAPYWSRRDLQARELGRAIAATPGVVVLGGDLNSGPFYRSDVWIDADGGSVPHWWDNAVAWGLWQHYGGLVDVFAAAGVAADVAEGSALGSAGDRARDTPYSIEGWCDAHRGVLFTGTDCNSLYMAQYAGTEPPARLDHIMLRDPERVVRVRGAGVTLTEPIDVGLDRPVELSDHYGVQATLAIARAR